MTVTARGTTTRIILSNDTKADQLLAWLEKQRGEFSNSMPGKVWSEATLEIHQFGSKCSIRICWEDKS